MKYILLIVVLFVLSFISNMHAQYTPRFIFKISAGTVANNRIFTFPYVDEQHPGGKWIDKEDAVHLRIGTTYSINKELEAGLYFGIANLRVSVNPNDIYNTTTVTTYSYFYGSEINYHILPLFIDRPIRFDIYGTAKIGVVSRTWSGYNDQDIYTDNIFEIGAGVGSAFYFTQKFSVFTEVLAGKFYQSAFNWRGGLNFRF